MGVTETNASRFSGTVAVSDQRGSGNGQVTPARVACATHVFLVFSRGSAFPSIDPTDLTNLDRSGVDRSAEEKEQRGRIDDGYVVVDPSLLGYVIEQVFELVLLVA